MSEMSEEQIVQALRKFDTATICNVVATHSRFHETRLNLYDAWYGGYYTDQTLRCMYPDLGPVCGYAATVWYSEASTDYTVIDRWALPEHLEATKKPIILVAKQTYPPELVNRCGHFGGNMTAEFKAQGVVGVVTDGPMRDYFEIQPQKVQYLATGLTSGHGKTAVRGVGIPVTVAGMAVSPGDIIHMDACGAVKFPASKLAKILEFAIKLHRLEAEHQKIFQEPGFSLTKWKESVK